MRGGAVAARRAHNPKVAGSSPAPATIKWSKTARLTWRFLIPIESKRMSNPSAGFHAWLCCNGSGFLNGCSIIWSEKLAVVDRLLNFFQKWCWRWFDYLMSVKSSYEFFNLIRIRLHWGDTKCINSSGWLNDINEINQFNCVFNSQNNTWCFLVTNAEEHFTLIA